MRTYGGGRSAEGGNWMEKQKWDEKVAKAMKKKKQDAEYAVMSKDRGRYSWSAQHPAYAGTSLCPDTHCRKKVDG